MEKRFGWHESLTPIRLSLAEYADARRRRRSLSLRSYIELESGKRQNGDRLCVALARELDAGRCLILLDGVDEIPDQGQRPSLIQAVDQFVVDHRSNRIVVTSRPAGYIRLAGQLTHLTLLPFSQKQMESFVYRWCRAREQVVCSSEPDLDAADSAANALVTSVKGNSRVEELATNPLMLVIIAAIHVEDKKLPEQRVELYERAVEMLMDTWNYWRSGAKRPLSPSKQLSVGSLMAVWASVAEWVHRTRPASVVQRTALRSQLIKALRTHGLNRTTSERTCDSYLDAAVNRAGLIEERGHNLFTFWHRSFEEFLAAKALATSGESMQERLLTLRDDPRWREVILLVVGTVAILHQDPSAATSLVAALGFDRPGPLEPLLHSHLGLATECAAENVGIDDDLVDRVIVQLATVLRDKPYFPFTRYFYQISTALRQYRPGPEAVSALSPLVQVEDSHLACNALRFIGNVAEHNENARRVCESTVSARNDDIRRYAALGLARAGNYSPEVWKALGFTHRNSLERANVEAPTREFLSSAPDAAIQGLVDWVAVAPVSKLAQYRLEPRGRGILIPPDHPDQRHVEAYRSMLLDRAEFERQLQAASILEEIGASDERSVAIAVSGLDAADEGFRFRAARLLLDIRQEQEKAVDALKHLLTSDDFSRRVDAAGLLVKAGCDKQNLVEALIPCLTERERFAAVHAGRFLVQHAPEDKRLPEGLRSLLAAEDLDLRVAGADLLLDLDRATSDMLDALFPCLTSDSFFRSHVGHTLARLASEDSGVCDTVLSWCHPCTLRIPVDAARTLLENLQTVGTRRVPALIAWLETDNSEMQHFAAYVLERDGHASEQICNVMLLRLQSDDPHTVTSAAEMLMRLGRTTEPIVAMGTDLELDDAEAVLEMCEQARVSHTLDQDQAWRLSKIVSVSSSDSRKQQNWRKWLFDWLKDCFNPSA